MLFVFIREEEKFCRLGKRRRCQRSAVQIGQGFARNTKALWLELGPFQPAKKGKVVLCLIKSRNEREKAGSQSGPSRHGGTVDSLHICAAVASHPTGSSR